MFAVKLVAKGVTGAYGLTREAMADHQAKKSSTNTVQQTQLAVPHDGKDLPEYSDTSSVSSDDEHAAQELDEAQQHYIELRHKDSSLEKAQNVDQVLDTFMQRHPPPMYSPSVTCGLSMPVILPQRRPKNKERGFVRAYAPMLRDCGIQQQEFLDFLDGFSKAIQLHPVFHAFNLAVGATATGAQLAGYGPGFLIALGAFAVHATVEVSRRQYVKYESNKYLDEMNEKFFKPHGLFALVMAYKPESDELIQDIDMNTHVVQSIATKETEGRKLRNKFANSSGHAHEFEIPESAPLIFPELEALPEGEKEGAFKRGGKNLANYFDHRAQVKFERENPGSKLNNYGQPHQFASRFSDPNSKANSGSLTALLSGGNIDTTAADQAKKDRRAMKRQYKDSRRMARGREPRYDASGMQKRTKQGGIKGLMKSEVLYLLIVNYPSEAELKEAVQVFEQVRY
jgi:hypothetical protein